MKRRILVVGGGFAGLWSAIGAARKRAELRAEEDVEISLIDRTSYHNIRVRNYEDDLSDVCIPFADVLAPVGVRVITGNVSEISVAERLVEVNTADRSIRLPYDRMIIALGSELVRPEIPGLREFAFDVDTYADASRLGRHLRGLCGRQETPGQFTAVVVGAGLTGLEVATELPGRLARIREASGSRQPVRVLLVDRLAHVGSDMGSDARPLIERALRDLGIEYRLDVSVERIEPDRILLGPGEAIDTSTVIWCAGMRANPLTSSFPGQRDRFGRLAVDEFLRVASCSNTFAAGDVASAPISEGHSSVMSCQHGRPMGRYAGHNAVADLLGAPMLPLHIDWYVTVLDLGPWGGIYTLGWDRKVFQTGMKAKSAKRQINRHRIYPPRSLEREELFAAAAPRVQKPPEVDSSSSEEAVCVA